MTQERSLEEKYRARLRRMPVVKKRIHQFRGLARKGVATVPDVLAKYDSLHRRTRRVVLDVIGFTGDRRVVPLLLRVFHEDRRLRQDAAMALGYLGGKRACSNMLAVLEREFASETPDARLWEPAFWSLSVMFCGNEAVEWAFLDVIARTAASPSIRSAALDDLGVALGEVDRRTSVFRRGRKVVLEALEDREDEVRFFAIYAVGQMRLEEALPRLRRMARTDRGSCPGLWTIAEEAQDVISHLTTGWWPDREPVTGRILDA